MAKGDHISHSILLGVVQLDADELFPPPAEPTDAETLLLEWARWWTSSDDAPSKMPGALHIRTSMYFVMKSLGDDHADD